MKKEDEIKALFDVETFERQQKLNELLWHIRFKTILCTLIIGALFQLGFLSLVETTQKNIHTLNSTLVQGGLAEYRIDPLTGNTEFKLFKVVNGQLVKE